MKNFAPTTNLVEVFNHKKYWKIHLSKTHRNSKSEFLIIIII